MKCLMLPWQNISAAGERVTINQNKSESMNNEKEANNRSYYINFLCRKFDGDWE